MANITSSNFINYCDKLVGSFAKARYAEGGYPTIQAGYGTYDSKDTAHKTLCILYGNFDDASLIEGTTPCTDIPRGYTVAIEENDTITEYQYKKVMPNDGYTVSDLEVKGAANIKKKSTDVNPLPTVNGTVSLNLTASDISYGNDTVNNALLGIEEDIHTINEDTGSLSNLTTQTKQNLVGAVNEVNSKTGNLAALVTNNKSSLVSAINEVVNKTSYVLVPSMSAIRRDSSGVPEVDFVNCTVKKIIGSVEYIEPTDHLYYIINGDRMYQGASVQLEPNDGIYSIEFILQPNAGMTLDSSTFDNSSMSIPLASVTVTIIKDGQKGENGNDGNDGARGSRGAILRGPSEWKSGVVYMGGAEGEEYQDMVLREIDGQAHYYLCHYTHTSSYDNIPDSHNDPSQWSSTTPWQVSETGDFVATKVLFAERATIGNVNIQGTITEECENMVDRILWVGKNELKSIYVNTNDDSDGYPTYLGKVEDDGVTVLEYNTSLHDQQGYIIQLPTFNGYRKEVSTGDYLGFRAYSYQTAGTRLSIFTTPLKGIENWAGFPFEMDPDTPSPYSYTTVLQDLLNHAVLVSADPQSLIGYYDVSSTTLKPEHTWGGLTLDSTDYKQGRFSYNGRIARFVLLLPGQHLDLISQIQYIGEDSNNNPIPTLVWNINNTADFTPAGINVFQAINTPSNISGGEGVYLTVPSSYSDSGASSGQETVLIPFMEIKNAQIDNNPLELHIGLAYGFTLGSSTERCNYPSWNIALTT